MIPSSRFAYFPWVVLCSHCMNVKRAKAHTLAGLSLHSYVTAPSVLIGLCIVGQSRDKNKNKMSHGQTWCSEEVKCLMDIWADELTSQMWNTAHRNSEVYEYYEHCWTVPHEENNT